MFEDVRDPAARVRAVCQYGCAVEVDPLIPPKRYFRSGREMIRMADVYYDEDNLESAFVLYSKFIALFIEKLPAHPDYKSLGASKEKTNNKQMLKEVFAKAEEVKKKLTEKFEHEEILRREEEVGIYLEERKREEERKVEEERRREEEERMRHEREKRRRQEQEDYFLALKMHEEEKSMHTSKTIPPPPSPPAPSPPIPSPSRASATPPRSPDQLPFVNDMTIPSIPPPSYESTRPEIDRSTKPRTDHFTSTGGQTSNKHGLRDIIVPEELLAKFLRLAQTNSRSNMETCGILCGQLSRNAFTITHLVIPKQTCTPDSCSTHNEEELFEYQDKFDLITLGWIHTHPSQTVFLSSVDLHTHASYQLMMPEAIAIVCSIKFDDIGYLRLTSDHGLNYIANCRKTGFHPHPDNPPLFEACPHVTKNAHGTITVVDLRN
ncbi:hypothetical protein NP493_786g01022 [Ridgeia piscesae]|uniref:MPN domain-containing protein n=1 Tax=Ridgeia piscesae TaxID=27915 RepID=A0AAD9NNA2_RIDPI|nr:hypothetical protein NP493_786g01022 [Ridgeia piscesae]